MKVFYGPLTTYGIIDVVGDDGNGGYSHACHCELEKQYGSPIMVMDDRDAIGLLEAKRTTEPKEITLEQFWYWLECLPPERWSKRGGAEVFHVSERITYSIVVWCVRIGERYFSVDASDRLLGSEVIDMVSRKFFPIKDPACSP